jgi:hypothetical protein
VFLLQRRCRQIMRSTRLADCTRARQAAPHTSGQFVDSVQSQLYQSVRCLHWVCVLNVCLLLFIVVYCCLLNEQPNRAQHHSTVLCIIFIGA